MATSTPAINSPAELHAPTSAMSAPHSDQIAGPLYFPEEKRDLSCFYDSAKGLSQYIGSFIRLPTSETVIYLKDPKIMYNYSAPKKLSPLAYEEIQEAVSSNQKN